MFARRLVMRNLHETSTQRTRRLYPDSKNNSRRIAYGVGCVWGMPSLSPLSSLGCTEYQNTDRRFLSISTLSHFSPFHIPLPFLPQCATQADPRAHRFCYPRQTGYYCLSAALGCSFRCVDLYNSTVQNSADY